MTSEPYGARATRYLFVIASPLRSALAIRRRRAKRGSSSDNGGAVTQG